MDHNRGSNSQTACYINDENWVTGLNVSGILGQSDRVNRSNPVQIPGTKWKSVSAGEGFALLVGCDSSLFAVGCNISGQLGQNHATPRSSPVQIPGTTWSSVAAGDCHSLALKNDNTLWSWGLNTGGQIGNGNVTSLSSPVQIPGTTWCEVASGICTSFALRTDGTLWGWGLNTAGKIGDSSIVSRSSPVQIPGTTWTTVTSGGATGAVRTDGTLWVWGCNGQGQLGLNDRAHRSSPTQIPGTTWSCIKFGANHALALRTDGTLWAWGQGTNGRLGNLAQAARSSPVQIPGTTWCDICTSGAAAFSLAKKTDGTVWGFGMNTGGELGIGVATDRSSPVQLPGTSWDLFASSNDNTFLAKSNAIVNGTFTGLNLANIWANDSANILFTPSTTYAFNDELYARDFKFCMGAKSKIIEANVITRNKSSSSGGSLYGGTSNGWYTIQLFDSNGNIGPDIGDKVASGFSTSWTNRYAKITSPSITPSQAMSNTFGVKLGSLATGTPVPVACVDSVLISLTTENSANSVSQASGFWTWNNTTDLM